ncbi:DUF2185 domain-containing protein [Stenotrophomonas rhizophila]|uniref:DUF2185 domain-containing protein n=1 Tax=Stenotrophomonas rhizophila TaxID=216778 RepID=UPI0011C3CED3|nr:DUF2185 domain-containing protein [Stenotrophomonas rhizophila]
MSSRFKCLSAIPQMIHRRSGSSGLNPDKSGELLQSAQQSKKGVTPPRNEAQVDHKTPRAAGGTNDPRKRAGPVEERKHTEIGQNRMSKFSQVGPAMAAIVREHIAKSGAVILCANREVPEEPADSGWQFSCGSMDENVDGAEVWSVREVLDVAPELEVFINLPPGVELSRAGPSSLWIATNTDDPVNE